MGLPIIAERRLKMEERMNKLLSLLSEIDGLVARKKMDMKMYNADIKARKEQATELRQEIEQSSMKEEQVNG